MDKKRKVILFAGTTEGRIIAEALENYDNVEIHVATEYGKQLLPESREGYQVIAGRMDRKQMMKVMSEDENQELLNPKPVVIDATHPFAVEVTENIMAAAELTNSEYYRVLREEADDEEWQNIFNDNVIMADDIEDAARILNKMGQKALVTTGSKELLPFTKVKNYQELLTIRILPLKGALRAAAAMGFEGQHLICMQGPFSVDMNRALIRQCDAKILVTKDSGVEGGFKEKLIACEKENIRVIVVKKPRQVAGKSIPEIFEILEERGFSVAVPKGIDLEQMKAMDTEKISEMSMKKEVADDKNSNLEKNKKTQVTDEEKNLQNTGEKNTEGRKKKIKRVSEKIKNNKENEEPRKWFPVFLDSSDKSVLIVGGGKIAERRAETLLKFQCTVTIWASDITDKIREMENSGEVRVKIKHFNSDNLHELDFNQYNMVIGATSDRRLNAYICKKAKYEGKLANDAGCKENCNFYFPAVSLKDNVTIGIGAQGSNHKVVSHVRGEIDGLLKKILKN